MKPLFVFCSIENKHWKEVHDIENIYRVIFLWYHVRNHHGFLTTIIFLRMIVFLLLGMVFSKKNRERERGVCGVEGQEVKRKR